MALPSRPMHVPSGLPIEQSVRPALLDVGAANVDAVNVRQTERGALSKRLGFAATSSQRFDGGARTAGHRLLSYRGTPCVIDGTWLERYSEEHSRWARTSRVPEASISTRPLLAVDNPRRMQAIHAVGGYLVCASFAEVNADGVSLLRVGVETVDGVLVRAPETLNPLMWGGTDRSADVSAEVCSHGPFVYVFLREPLRAEIWLWRLDTTSPSTIAAGWTDVGAWIDDADTAAGPIPSRTWATESLEDRVAIAYVNDDDEITIQSLNDGGLIDSATIVAASAPRAIAMAGRRDDTLWVAWDEPDVCVQGLGPLTFSTTATKAVIYANAGAPIGLQVLPTVAGAARVFFNAAPDDVLGSTSFHASGGATVPDIQSFTNGLWTRSRAMLHDGRQYAMLYGPSETGDPNGAAILGDVTPEGGHDPMRPVACAHPALVMRPERLPRIVQIGADRWAVPTLVRRSAVQIAVDLVTFDFADRARWRSAEHNGALYLAGGMLSYFDGERVAEAGFLLAPGKPAIVADPPGALWHMCRYVATYEEEDAAGNWSVSSVSEPSDLAEFDATTPDVDVLVHGLSVTARRRVRVRVYRTLDGGEPPYYYWDERINDVTSGLNGGLILFSDDLSVNDAELRRRRKLYAPNLPDAAGEALDRRAPPYCSDVASYNGMLVLASGSTLWWSGQRVEGEGCWFNPIFTVPVEGDGEVTAIGAQDATLNVWKRGSIHAVLGSPPSDNGTVGGLGAPQRLALNVGCVDPCSVVATSLGTFFQSERGIELLSRSGDAAWVGAQVQTTLATYPVITAAVLDARQGIVRFSLAKGEVGARVSGEGRDLVFDLSLQAWISVDDKFGASVHEASQDAATAIVGGTSRYAWIGADGTMYRERDASDADAYLDGSTFVPSQYTLPPWKMGLQQEQRIYEMELLFEPEGAAGLEIDIACDYGDFDETKAWAAAEIADARQVSFRPKPQTTAVQLRVRDTATEQPGAGRGVTFIGVSADIAPKQGATRGTTRINPALRR